MAMAVGVAAAVQQRRLEQQQPEHDVLLVTQYVFNASRCDVQYVVDFLKSSRHNTWLHHHPVVTKLKFHSWQQQQPASTSDGGGSLFECLERFFTNQQMMTTIIKGELCGSNFVSAEATSQRVLKIGTNASVTHLTIRQIVNLAGAALDRCLSGLLQNKKRPSLDRAPHTMRTQSEQFNRPPFDPTVI
jgi:hypothetical protein